MSPRRKTVTAANPARLSAMEALRLLCMYMVLVLHADYAALGVPDAGALWCNPLATVARVFFEQCAIVAVNVFVLISGWFSIRAGAKGAVSLLFQVWWCAALVIGVAALCGFAIPGDVWQTFVPGWHHWFIRSYLGLMIVAPVLNAFVRTSTLRAHALVVLLFYIFQSIYGWLLAKDGFGAGYSLLSFIGLYLLAALARRGAWQSRRGACWLMAYLVCTGTSTGLSIWMLRSTGRIPAMLTAYDSPLVVLSALALLLSCAVVRSQWRSKVVNNLAASALAVYLLHFNPLVFKHFLGVCRDIWHRFGSLGCVAMMALWLLGVMAVCLLVDVPRRLIWNRLLPLSERLKFVKSEKGSPSLD